MQRNKDSVQLGYKLSVGVHQLLDSGNCNFIKSKSYSVHAHVRRDVHCSPSVSLRPCCRERQRQRCACTCSDEKSWPVPSTNEQFHTKVVGKVVSKLDGRSRHGLSVRFLELVCPRQPPGRPLTALTRGSSPKNVGRQLSKQPSAETYRALEAHAVYRAAKVNFFLELCRFSLNLLLRPSCIPKGSARRYGRWIVHAGVLPFSATPTLAPR